MIKIEFDGSGADPAVAALIEQHVREAIKALRCFLHSPGWVSFRVDEAHVGVIDACCKSFLHAVRDAVGNAMA